MWVERLSDKISSSADDWRIRRHAASGRVDPVRQQLGVSDADWSTLDEGNQETLIRTVVKRVTYDRISGTYRWTSISNTHENQICTIHTSQSRPKSVVVSPPMVARNWPPRITSLALANKFEGLVQSGKIRDCAELARAGLVSRARVSQILKLLTLAPSIQEFILEMPPRIAGKEGLTERDLRKVVREPLWYDQRMFFEKL
jgi:hypothetical protein